MTGRQDQGSDPPSEVPGTRTARDEWAIETMARQQAIVKALEARAQVSAHGDTACTLWGAVRRQAGSYHRYLDEWTELGGFERSLPEIAHHRLTLERSVACAGEAWHGFDGTTQHDSLGRLGIRVAVMGKGGAGKTLIASTLARTLARRGRQVLAADLDTSPGLSMSLGLPDSDLGLPVGVVAEHTGGNYGWHLAPRCSPTEVVRNCSMQGADGVRLLGIGKIGVTDKGGAKRSAEAIEQVLLGFGDPDCDVIADLAAGVTTPFEHYHAFADHVIVVVGPGRSSAMVARHLREMVGPRRLTIVANRFRDEPDHLEVTPDFRIPFDAAVQSAERAGLAPIDACGGGPAMRAIAQLAEGLVDLGVGV